jgi:ribosomal protein L16 Arg81 hydroxylase
MISSLKELVSPLTEAAFFELLRARSFTFQRSSRNDRFQHLLNWNALRDIIENGIFPPSELRVTNKTEPVAPLFYLQNGKVSAEKLAKLLRQGASLIVVPIDPYLPAVDALCADIRARTNEKIKAGAIVTTGDTGALKYHFDTNDLIIIQLEGSKRWRIYGPPVANPLKKDDSLEPHGIPIFDDVMRPGDFLFLPAGYCHHCDNGPDLSLHLGIFFEPPTGYQTVADATKALLPQLIEEEIFRIPLTRLGDATNRIALEAAIKSRLIEKLGQIFLFEPPFKNADTTNGPLTPGHKLGRKRARPKKPQD